MCVILYVYCVILFCLRCIWQHQNKQNTTTANAISSTCYGREHLDISGTVFFHFAVSVKAVKRIQSTKRNQWPLAWPRLFTHCWTSEGILCQLPLLPSKTVLVGSRSTVQLQNRSPWHREPQYSLVVIIHIDNVTWCSNVSDIEAVEACIRFLSDDDDYRSYADTVVWSIILFLLSQVVVKNLSARCTCLTLVNHVV